MEVVIQCGSDSMEMIRCMEVVIIFQLVQTKSSDSVSAWMIAACYFQVPLPQIFLPLLNSWEMLKCDSNSIVFFFWACSSQQMAPAKQVKVIREFQKQSAQLDMTVILLLLYENSIVILSFYFCVCFHP